MSPTQPHPLDELVEVDQFRIMAESVMPDAYRDFVNNVGMEETLRDDLAAWRAMHLRPRALVDVSQVDTAVTVLGTRIAQPVITAPFVGSSFVDVEGEAAIARGAVAADSITTLSMMGSRGPELVGSEAAGRYWQQLYWLKDRSIVTDIVQRAVASGASALCITVDLPILPAFPSRMRQASQTLRLDWADERHMMYAVRDYADKPDHGKFPDPSATWDDVEWLAGVTDLPLILKGIIRPEDAVLAQQNGASAVVVSNHAGQGLRFSQPVAHALPAIVDAVGDDVEVLADSGIRTGSDVARAVALGARAVLVGRPVLWGLAAGGAEGVERVLRILRDELAEVMAITGTPSVADIDAAILAPVRSEPVER